MKSQEAQPASQSKQVQLTVDS